MNGECSGSARVADSSRSIPKAAFRTGGQPVAHLKITRPSGAKRDVSGLEVRLHHRGRRNEPARALSCTELLPASPVRGRTILNLAIPGCSSRCPRRTGALQRARGIRGASRRRTSEATRRRAGRSDRSEDEKGMWRSVLAVPAISFEYRKDRAAAGFVGGRRKQGAQGLCGSSFACADARDLAINQVSHSRSLSRKYYLSPRRNYFKLGAAFYWPAIRTALPYLARDAAGAPRELEGSARHGAHSTGTGPQQRCAGIVPAGDR